MESFLHFFEVVLDFFKMPMTVYGFTFSFWDIILWGCVAYIAIRIVRGLWMDENLMNEQVESAAEQGSESPVPPADSEQPAETSSAASDTETGDDAAPAADAEQQEQQTLSEITGTVTVDNLYDRPIMTTPFSEYTVVEALLLLSLLLGLVRTLFRIWNN